MALTGDGDGAKPLPWHNEDDSGGVTYTQYVAPDGPQGGNLAPGTIYSVGSNGSFSVSYTPPKPASVSITNTPIQSQGGRYDVRTDSDGSITGIPGAVYQIDTYDGSVSIVSKPTHNVNPADKNNDGLDDTTNMALGVYKDSNSPTGYSYGMGQPVYPNGAPYQGGGGMAEPKVTTVGGVPYIWDPTAGRYVPAPGITPSGSSSGGSISVNGPRVSNGGGSSSASAASSRDYAAEQAASDERQAAMQRDARAFQAAENQKDRDARAAEFQANYGLSVAQFAAQQQKDAADQRRNTINDFRSAVNDVDPNAVRALQYANGIGAGGNLVSEIIGKGKDALSLNALAGAAGLLGQLRGTPSEGLGDWVQQFPGLAGIANSTAPAGTQTVLPAGTPLPSGTQTVQPLQRPSVTHFTAPPQTVDPQAQERADYYNPANWKEEPSLTGMPTYVNTKLGDRLSAQQYGAWIGTPATYENQLSIGNAGEGGLTGEFAMNPVKYDALGQASGTSYQTQFPGVAGYQTPGAPNVISLEGDNIAKPVGNLEGDNIQRGIDLPYKTTIPGLARGGTAYGTMLVGERGPEIVHAPMGAQVVPITKPVMRGLQRGGMPGYAFGTFGVGTNPLFSMFSHPTYSTPPQTTPATAPAATPAAPIPGLSGGATSSTAPQPTATATTPTQTAGSPTSTTTSAPTTTTGATQPTSSTPAVPVTVGSLSGNYDVSNLTPTQQGLFDEIANFRRGAEGTDLGGYSPYSLEFANLNPYAQQAYYAAAQTRYGIPAAALQWEVEHNRQMMPGLSRGQAVVGY